MFHNIYYKWFYIIQHNGLYNINQTQTYSLKKLISFKKR